MARRTRSRRLPQSSSSAVPQTAAAQSRTQSSGGYTRPGGYSRRTPSFGGSAWDRRPSMSGGYGRPTTSRPSRSGSAGSLPGRRATRPSHAILARGARSLPSARRSPRTTRVGLRPGRLGRGMGRGDATRWGDRRPAGTGMAVRHGHHRPLQTAPGPSLACGMRCSCGICSIHCRDPGMRTSSIIMPLIQAIPPGGRKRIGGLQKTRRCAKSWLNWIRASRPCRRNHASKITYHPMRHPAIALAADEEGGDSGWGLGLILFLVLVGVVVWFAWRRLSASRRAQEAGGASGEPSGTSYRPDWFRVGMTFPVDPTPFILAANMTHVQAPEGATASGLISVEAVGEVTTDGVRWHRCICPADNVFFRSISMPMDSLTSAATSRCSMRSCPPARRSGPSGSMRRRG